MVLATSLCCHLPISRRALAPTHRPQQAAQHLPCNIGGHTAHVLQAHRLVEALSHAPEDVPSAHRHGRHLGKKNEQKMKMCVRSLALRLTPSPNENYQNVIRRFIVLPPLYTEVRREVQYPISECTPDLGP